MVMLEATRERVVAKFKEIYPQHSVTEILTILDQYGDEKHESAGSIQVRGCGKAGLS